MGSIVGLSGGAIEAVLYIEQFLDEPDNIALCESVLAPKPRPRPEHSAYWTMYRPPKYGFEY